MSTEKSRLVWIDWAKVFGLFLVIYLHVHFVDPQMRRYLMTFIIPFFFFISGYLFKEPSEYWGFFKKNVSMLIVPFILYNLIALAYFSAWFYFFTNDGLAWYIESSLKGILLFSSSYEGAVYPCLPAWFLMALFWARLFCGGATTSVKKAVFFAIWLAAFIGLWGRNWVLPAHIDSAVYCLPYFVFGYIFKRLNLFKYADNILAVSPLFTLALLAFYFLVRDGSLLDFSSVKFDSGWRYRYTVPTFGILSLVFFSMFFAKLPSRIVKDISDGSLLILCLHPIFLSVGYFLLNKLSLKPAANGIVSPVWISLFCMLAGYVCILLSQRYAPILIGKPSGSFARKG